MRTVPKPIDDALSFFELRLDDWAADPSSIGLTTEQVERLADLTETARSAWLAARQARIEATGATQTQSQAVAAMRRFGGDLIATIRAYAETSDDRRIYASAKIDPPAGPSPLGPPETPTGMGFTLGNTGTVTIHWNASREGGTSFIIERNLTGQLTDWAIIGVAETKSFTDGAVPSGLPLVAYRVRAVRTGGASDTTSPLHVYFGNLQERSNQPAFAARVA